MNSTKMWCATILISTAMISLAIMSSGYVIGAKNAGIIDFCMFACAVVGIGGIAWLLFPGIISNIIRIWNAIPIPEQQDKSKTDKKTDE